MMHGEEPVYCLLVDDLAENLLALEALLKRDGLICLKAQSGEEALELLLAHDVALALLDVQMPGMDGFQLAEFMRGSERTRHVPIIFLTAGSAEVQRKFRGYEAGAVDFIQKPLEAHVLRSKAAVFFDLYEQRRRVTSQRDELGALTGALKRADTHKNQFLAMLGHELRNPVMALQSGLNLLEKREGTEQAREIRFQMGRSISHLSRLVEDLLDIARIDQGKIALKSGRILLQDALSYAVEACLPAVEADGHTLIVDITSEPVWLMADDARIAQIVINLINNAVKYTPEPGEIRLTARVDGETARMDVADSGIGIPYDAQESIFDLFAQVPGAGRAAQDGLGIGLALVKQLVELHGGTIALKFSEPGVGSTFEVCLPLEP